VPQADAVPDRAPWRSPATVGDVVLAGGVAAVLSGVPSTLDALVRGRDPLEATLAAGTLLLPAARRPRRLFVAAAAVHATLSLSWAAVLAVSLPRRRRYAWATLAAIGIAGLDLGIVGRRFPRIRALPTFPQVADHLAYAWTVTAVLNRRQGRRRSVGA
jgi:hypothetical protein